MKMWYDDIPATHCEVCEGIMIWIECPTGGWWRHIDHPEDSHDGEAPIDDVAREIGWS